MPTVPISSSPLKELLLKHVRFEDEFRELLGAGRIGTRRCWNVDAHKSNDMTPSLAYSTDTGGWRCQTCGESGDIFTLYNRVKKMTYIQALIHLLEKYGLRKQASELHKWKHGSKDTKPAFPVVTDPAMLQQWHKAVNALTDRHYEWLHRQYGLTRLTVNKARLGFYGRRLVIPIYQRDPQIGTNGLPHESFPAIVNMKYHDAFRMDCSWRRESDGVILASRPEEITQDDAAMGFYHGWRPYWKSGKSRSIQGHGATYVYPMDVLYKNETVWLVGGEFKAILLNQLGIPAVCYTGGEGSWSPETLGLFLGKRVNILMDIDDAGEEAADKLAAILCAHGARTYRGRWPEAARAVLPAKGDVTDYLRLAGWDVEVLQYIEFDLVDTYSIMQDSVMQEEEAAKLEEIPWKSVRDVGFKAMQDPKLVDTWMRVRGMVSGRGDTPTVVPRDVFISCDYGRSTGDRKCSNCSLPQRQYRMRLTLSTDEQLGMSGSPKSFVDEHLMRLACIPPKCVHPEFRRVNTVVEDLVLTPTLEISKAEIAESDSLNRFEFRHQQATALGEERLELEENTAYGLVGKLSCHPRTGKMVFAVRHYQPLEDDMRRFKYNKAINDRLVTFFASSGSSAAERISRLVSQVRDYLTQVVGQDDMHLAELASMFMPLNFRMGQYSCDRICATTLVLGDSSVGKSAVATRLMKHYRAGRVMGAAASTNAGWVGGTVHVGNQPKFAWGILPTSDQTWLAIDESNKLSEEQIGQLTQLISSGIAERTTNQGPRRTFARVRTLLLANPRGERPLRSYPNPLDAARGVMYTDQDLGRVDLFFAQYAPSETAQFRKYKTFKPDELGYAADVARYHLQWAWWLSQDVDRIEFDDPAYIWDRAVDLSHHLHGHPLVYPTMAKWKLGRLAASFAAMEFSVGDGMRCIVRKQHVDMAWSTFDRFYSPYIRKGVSDSKSLLPNKLVKYLDKLVNPQELSVFTIANQWSDEDFDGLFSTRSESHELKRMLVYDLGLIRLRGRFYEARDGRFREYIESYISERERQLVAESIGGY